MLVAIRRRHHAGHRILMHQPFADAENSVVHRHIDELALTTALRQPYCGDDAEGAHQTWHDVADPRPGFHRCIGARPGNAHQATHGLRDDVEGRPVGIGAAAGTRIAKAAHCGIHQPWVLRAQGFIGEAQSIHHADPEILDYHVGLARHLTKGIDIGRTFKIEHDAALVAVHAVKIAAVALVGIGGMIEAQAACDIAARWFNLDHIGAVVGKHHGAIRASQDLREIEHQHAIQHTLQGIRIRHGKPSYRPCRADCRK